MIADFTDTVVIDGFTQPGAVLATISSDASPMIELDGSLTPDGTDGLTITAGNSTVRGLVINGFPQVQQGHGIVLSGVGGNVIEGNFIGTDVTGTLDRGNRGAGILVQSGDGNRIGGSTPAARNIVSGNTFTGIRVQSSQDLVIIGNYIGMDVSGTQALGNSGSGVELRVSSSNTRVGGIAAGEGNVISDNGRLGIFISSSDNNIVQGNLIGLDATGTAGQGDSAGIAVQSGAEGNLIGGTTSTARNIISGNDELGIRVSNADDNRFYGNYVGTDITGTVGVGNRDGVFVEGSNNHVGGLAEGQGNVISGNTLTGVTVENDGPVATDGNLIAGNYIGTDFSGMLAVANFTGVHFSFGTTGTTVVGNVISANRTYGLNITSGKNNVIQGNLIGTDMTGAAPLGNQRGIGMIGFFTTDNLIGGTTAGDGNTIAFNQLSDISVNGSSQRNAVLGNSIHSNGELGIDLVGDGPTPNDAADADQGPNNLQNFPSLVGDAQLITGALRIEYSVPSAPVNSTYDLRIEFFIADDEQEEGKTILGFDTFTAAEFAAGLKTITLPAGNAVAGDFLVATATDADGNTSEFSAPILVFYDGNGDGVADSEQDDVSSVPNAVTGSYITVAVPSSNVLSSVNVTSIPPGAANPLDAVEFPMGFVQFTMSTTSATTVAELYLPEDVDVNTYYKFGPTPEDTSPHYYEFLFDGTTGAELLDLDGDGDADKIVLHFVDGGRGDADLTANGVIVDPGAPGFSASRQLQPAQPAPQSVFSIFTPPSPLSTTSSMRSQQVFGALPRFPVGDTAAETGPLRTFSLTRLDVLNESLDDDNRRDGLLEWYDEAATILNDIGELLPSDLLDEWNPRDEGDDEERALDQFWKELGRALLGAPGYLLRLNDVFDVEQPAARLDSGEEKDAQDPTADAKGSSQEVSAQTQDRSQRTSAQREPLGPDGRESNGGAIATTRPR